MTRLRAAALAVGLAYGAGSAAAEEAAPEDLQRTHWLIERGAHRALARLRGAGAALAPFETDECSGGLSAAWGAAASGFAEFADAFGADPPWEGCCVAHDRLYHAAGPDPAPMASYAARLQADSALERCVLDTGEATTAELAARHGVEAAQVRAAYEAVARAMFFAVRLGGAPCSGLPWRWGYGYPHCVAGPQDLWREGEAAP